MVHLLVKAIQQLRPYDTVIRRLVANDILLLSLAREVIKGIDSFRVENFIDAEERIILLVLKLSKRNQTTHNGLSSLGFRADPPVKRVTRVLGNLPCKSSNISAELCPPPTTATLWRVSLSARIEGTLVEYAEE